MLRLARAPHLPRSLEAMSVRHLDDGDAIEHGELSGELAGLSADRVSITESRVDNVRFTASELPRMRLRDVAFERCDLSGVVLEGARLERCSFTDCRLSGAVFADARLRHVTFESCRVDTVSFRRALLEMTRFERCDLRQADFYEAQMPAGQLLHCQLVGADFSKATLTGTELHGSDLDELIGVLALRDVVIDPVQIATLAQAFLTAHGIAVTDGPTTR